MSESPFDEDSEMSDDENEDHPHGTRRRSVTTMDSPRQLLSPLPAPSSKLRLRWRTGDVLLFRYKDADTNLSSKAILSAQQNMGLPGYFTHVGVVVGEGFAADPVLGISIGKALLFHATSSKVPDISGSEATGVMLCPAAEYVKKYEGEVYRRQLHLEDGLTSKHRMHSIYWAISVLQQEFGGFKAMVDDRAKNASWFLRKILPDCSNKWYCSRLALATLIHLGMAESDALRSSFDNIRTTAPDRFWEASADKCYLSSEVWGGLERLK